MAIFRDSSEACSYVGKMFELFVEKEEFEDKIKESGLVVRLNYTEPDAAIVIDFPNQAVYCNEHTSSAPASNVEMFMKCDDAHRFWLGRLNFPIAMARKKIRMEGSTAKAMKLLPLTTPLFETYKELLVDAGREDLLTV